MSDYTTRGHGMGGRGVLIALAVIAVFVVGLGLLGTASNPIDSSSVGSDPSPAATPAVSD